MTAEMWLFVLGDAFWSAVAAVGFAILFNVPRYSLPACALTGALGHAFRAALIISFGLPVEAATLLAGTAVGFLGELFARHYHIPRLIFCGSRRDSHGSWRFCLPYHAGHFELAGVANLTAVASAEVLLQTAVYAIRTGLILAGLSFGIIAPNLLFRRQRPVI
ncbi:MAG: threonine/serine exporter family protein [Chloroflexi bacterium]|nr:threonine/serine exporter family protein [Chloroflexota bacterium]